MVTRSYVVSIEKHECKNECISSKSTAVQAVRVVSRIDDEEEPTCFQCQIPFKERRNRLTRETSISMMIAPRIVFSNCYFILLSLASFRKFNANNDLFKLQYRFGYSKCNIYHAENLNRKFKNLEDINFQNVFSYT